MSDSDSDDSERGIRFKTESVRQKADIKFRGDSPIERPKTRRARHSSSSDDDDRKRSRKLDRDRHSRNSRRQEKKTRNTRSASSPQDTIVEASKSETEESLRENIGPQLPPHLMQNKDETTLGIAIFQKNSNVNYCDAPFGPALPPSKSKELDVKIGPQLPPHVIHCLDNTKDVENKILDDETKTYNTEVIGPSLPHSLIKERESNGQVSSHLRKAGDIDPIPLPPSDEVSAQKDTKTIGPILPPHLRKQLEEQAVEDQMEYEQSSSENEETFGPLPVGAQQSASQIALEERAMQMKLDKLLPQNDEPTRESWMTELPDARIGDFGLGPRQFRKRAAPDMSDRSSWTTVAGEKSKPKEVKMDLKTEAEEREIRRRDKEQEQMTKKHKRKSKSLVAMHQETLEKSDKGAGSSMRRPFNRETDLQVNKFDDAQRKAVLKKAQLLDDRFSSGKSKFL